MSVNIVQTARFLTLLGGSSTHFSHLNQALSLAPILVAADGGADIALAAGHIPEAVIGDLDSISETTRVQVPPERLHRVSEQDSTDFVKCLRRIEAPAILAVGFSGGWLDHQLAVCTALVAHADKRVILLGEHDICCLAPPSLSLELPVGTRLSLFPMGPVTGRSKGLAYPIDGLRFAPDGQIGTSNEVTGPVHLTFDTPNMLLLLPRAHLETLLHALAGSA